MELSILRFYKAFRFFKIDMSYKSSRIMTWLSQWSLLIPLPAATDVHRFFFLNKKNRVKLILKGIFLDKFSLHFISFLWFLFYLAMISREEYSNFIDISFSFKKLLIFIFFLLMSLCLLIFYSKKNSSKNQFKFSYILQSLFFSFLVHLMNPLLLVCSAKIFDYSINIATVFEITPLLLLSLSLPLLFNGIGARESLLIYYSQKLSLSNHQALILALTVWLSSFINIVPSFIFKYTRDKE